MVCRGGHPGSSWKVDEITCLGAGEGSRVIIQKWAKLHAFLPTLPFSTLSGSLSAENEFNFNRNRQRERDSDSDSNLCLRVSACLREPMNSGELVRNKNIRIFFFLLLLLHLERHSWSVEEKRWATFWWSSAAPCSPAVVAQWRNLQLSLGTLSNSNKRVRYYNLTLNLLSLRAYIYV